MRHLGSVRLALACVGIIVAMPSLGRSADSVLPLMPLPSHLEVRDGSLPIDARFQVAGCGLNGVFLRGIVSRFAERFATATGIFLPLAATATDCDHATLAIECERIVARPALGNDESYTLEITSGSARLRAATSTGVLRGLATFQQLVRAGPSGFTAPAVLIEDHPRFPWRGLMLDVARHWMPIAVVERNLDAMEAVKLNVFHWHLSDDQGFRVESRIYPKLQGLGSDGHFYTQAQIRHIVAYAAERGIRVVPEFDIPGHATSWAVGYPELISAPGPYALERNWGIFEPVMDPSRESTYRFLDRFVGEMGALFPDPYFHIGGDEVLDAQWKSNPQIQRFMAAHSLATSEKLHGYFNGRVQAILTRHGKKMIGWDEILTPELAKSAVIQSWRGQDSLAAAARQGYRGLLSFGYYLNQMRPASFHYANDPLGGGARSLTPEQAALILGGEACMWSEYVNPETVDSRIWPRLASIAERFWSPADVTDPENMYDRLEVVSRQLEWMGTEHRSGPERVLHRMARLRPAPVLTVMAGAVSSSGIDDRYPSHKYNSLEPLNRFVDATVAETESIRHLTRDARTAASAPGAHPEASARLREAFEQWREVRDRAAPLAAESFLVAEAMPVADILSRLGEAGAKTLDAIEHGQKPSAEWLQEQRSLLDTAGKLTAEVRVTAGEVVRVLLDALSDVSGPAKP